MRVHTEMITRITRTRTLTHHCGGFLHQLETPGVVPFHSQALKNSASISQSIAVKTQTPYPQLDSSVIQVEVLFPAAPSSAGWSSRTLPKRPSSAERFPQTTSARRPCLWKLRGDPSRASLPGVSGANRCYLPALTATG